MPYGCDIFGSTWAPVSTPRSLDNIDGRPRTADGSSVLRNRMRAGAGGAGQAGRLLEDGAWRIGVCASKVSVEGTDGTSTASWMDVATRTGT